jgi:hypothetical protein
MVVFYNIRPSNLAVHMFETTPVMCRMGVVRTATLAVVVSPTIQDETRKCLGKGLNKYLLLLVEACKEEESLQYDSVRNGRLAHSKTLPYLLVSYT